MQGKVLVVDDEADVRLGLRTVLTAEGLTVIEAADGEAALEAVTLESPDLLVLDLMMPKLDGFQVCRALRARGLTVPVLVLTARASEVDKVLGLELGADDYVTKPFGVRELVARVRALLRRAQLGPTQAPQPQPGDTIVVGDATVDLRRMSVKRAGERFELYHFEAEILKLLVGREGEAIDRKEILNRVWGLDAFPTTRTVDYHVCNLRKKLEPDPKRPRHLLTAHGVGYRYVS